MALITPSGRLYGPNGTLGWPYGPNGTLGWPYGPGYTLREAIWPWIHPQGGYMALNGP